MEMTQAKTGRSMKKRASTSGFSFDFARRRRLNIRLSGPWY